jgi:hypothetical protein
MRRDKSRQRLAGEGAQQRQTTLGPSPSTGEGGVGVKGGR